MTDPHFRLYAQNAAMLAERFEALAPGEVYAPISEFLPDAPSRIGDIGAGSGRDAAWLARQGHVIVAAEPVAELRAEAQARHGDADIEWVDDSLPDLRVLRAVPRFDFLIISGVWHHVIPESRATAMEAISACLKPTGRVIFALRHGEIDPARGVFAGEADEVVTLAQDAGMILLVQRSAESHDPVNRAAGIERTLLVFERSSERPT